MSENKDKDLAQEIADDVSFTEADLNDNMIRQPSLVAHYGRLLAENQYKMDLSKQKMEIAESRAAHLMREEANEDGKKITEALINSTLPTITSVVEARISYNKAKRDYEAMKHALEAFRHKKDMMIQIGVNRRTEMDNKIRGLELRDQMDGQEDRDRELRQEAKSSFKAA